MSDYTFGTILVREGIFVIYIAAAAPLHDATFWFRAMHLGGGGEPVGNVGHWSLTGWTVMG